VNWELIGPIIAVGLFAFWWWYSKDRRRRREIPEPYLSVKNLLWPMYEEIYRSGPINCILKNVVEISAKDAPSDHMAGYWAVGYDTVWLVREGYGGYSKLHWFGGELHNVIRYQLKLTLGEPTDPLDLERHRTATALWKEID
jgi:hypothetical protein